MTAVRGISNENLVLFTFTETHAHYYYWNITCLSSCHTVCKHILLLVTNTFSLITLSLLTTITITTVICIQVKIIICMKSLMYCKKGKSGFIVYTISGIFSALFRYLWPYMPSRLTQELLSDQELKVDGSFTHFTYQQCMLPLLPDKVLFSSVLIETRIRMHGIYYSQANRTKLTHCWQ
jgi:hypothetical protein